MKMNLKVIMGLVLGLLMINSIAAVTPDDDNNSLDCNFYEEIISASSDISETGSSQPLQYVTLVANDGLKCVFTRAAAEKSKMIKTILDVSELQGEVVLPNVNSETFRQLISVWKMVALNASQHDFLYLLKWYVCGNYHRSKSLRDILMAANFLDIPQIFDACVNVIADYLNEHVKLSSDFSYCEDDLVSKFKQDDVLNVFKYNDLEFLDGLPLEVENVIAQSLLKVMNQELLNSDHRSDDCRQESCTRYDIDAFNEYDPTIGYQLSDMEERSIRHCGFSTTSYFGPKFGTLKKLSLQKEITLEQVFFIRLCFLQTVCKVFSRNTWGRVFLEKLGKPWLFGNLWLVSSVLFIIYQLDKYRAASDLSNKRALKESVLVRLSEEGQRLDISQHKTLQDIYTRMQDQRPDIASFLATHYLTGLTWMQRLRNYKFNLSNVDMNKIVDCLPSASL